MLLLPGVVKGPFPPHLASDTVYQPVQHCPATQYLAMLPATNPVAVLLKTMGFHLPWLIIRSLSPARSLLLIAEHLAHDAAQLVKLVFLELCTLVDRLCQNQATVSLNTHFTSSTLLHVKLRCSAYTDVHV